MYEVDRLVGHQDLVVRGRRKHLQGQKQGEFAVERSDPAVGGAYADHQGRRQYGIR
ncbi:MAG TPA: hypothetical protein VGK54_13760 [Chloroflexota bacterium]|jgi:hypothetical protein